jgi:methylmalonyl-CoA/ethylmalonyl-CoA epimerase
LNPFGEVDLASGLTFHHIGVACRDLEREERDFSILGYRREGTDFHDPTQGVHGRFLIGPGPRLELLKNDTNPGVLTPWLKKGIRFYHLAYESADMVQAGIELVAHQARQVVAPVPAVAFGGRLICFYMLRNMTLIELISTKPVS